VCRPPGPASPKRYAGYDRLERDDIGLNRFLGFRDAVAI